MPGPGPSIACREFRAQKSKPTPSSPGSRSGPEPDGMKQSPYVTRLIGWHKAANPAKLIDQRTLVVVSVFFTVVVAGCATVVSVVLDVSLVLDAARW